MKMRTALMMAMLLTALVMSGCSSSEEPSINLNEGTDPSTIPPADGQNLAPDDLNGDQDSGQDNMGKPPEDDADAENPSDGTLPPDNNTSE